MAPPKSAMARLFDHFHHDPRGRFHEFLFFFALGAIVLLFAWWSYKKDWLNEPLAWIVALVGACLLLFGVLPQKKRAPPPPPPPGKRGKIAEQVKASKAEKRKGPPPPIQ